MSLECKQLTKHTFQAEGQVKPHLVIVVNNIDYFISHRNYLASDSIINGFSVTVVYTLHKFSSLRPLEKLGVNLVRVPLFTGNLNPFKEIINILATFSVLKNLKPQILHLVSIKPIIYGGIFSRLFLIKNVIYAFSGLGYLFEEKRSSFKEILMGRWVLIFVANMLLKAALRKNDSRFIFQNEDDKGVITNRFSIGECLCEVFPGSGVSISDFKYKSEDLNTKVITMAARLLKSKGVHEFILAANLLKGWGLDYKFILAGDFDTNNPSNFNIKKLRQLNKNNAVELVGFYEDLKPLLYSTNLFVLPSHREGLPKVVLEAAAIGRAIITTNVPGCRDAIVPNKTGLLVEVSNPEALAIAIYDLMKNNEKRKEYGVLGAKLTRKKFGTDKISDLHLKLYKSLLMTN